MDIPAPLGKGAVRPTDVTIASEVGAVGAVALPPSVRMVAWKPLRARGLGCPEARGLPVRRRTASWKCRDGGGWPEGSSSVDLGTRLLALPCVRTHV